MKRPASFRSLFMKWSVHAAGVLCLVVAPLAAQNLELALDEGIRFYWNGEYEQTIGILQTACGMDATSGEKTDCHKYLAFSHIALGDESRADTQFAALLNEDPGYRLDQELVSPKIIRRFDTSRRQLADQLYAEGKEAYYRKDFKRAHELMEDILLLEPDDDLAREYRELSSERLSIDETRAAEAKAEPEPTPEPPEQEDRVYRVTSEVRRPELLQSFDPEYPRIDRMRRKQGTVVLSVVIDEQGRVRESTVIRSVSETIDAAAREAVGRWRYRPAYLNGHAVSVHGMVRLNFQLQ